MKEISVGITYGISPSYGASTEVLIDADTYRRCGLKHASAYGPQAALAALAVTSAAPEDRSFRPRRALLTNGGPWAMDTALAFLHSAHARGPQYVNPLQFPMTLVSAAPSSIAAMIGAGVCGVAIGHDELAFFDMLRHGVQLLRRGLADEVFLAAAVAPSPALNRILHAADPNVEQEVGYCSICFVLGTASGGALILEESMVLDSEPKWSEASLYRSEIGVDGVLRMAGVGPEAPRFLSASGAVACQQALARSAAPGAIGIICKARGKVGAALFRRQPLFPS